MLKNKYLKKRINYILIIMIFIMIIINIVPKLILQSYAVTYTYTNESNDLPTNFDQTYPGYKNLIINLAKQHPNWTFRLYETNLEWETVINSEYQGHGFSPKNLVPSNYDTKWICSICGNKSYDSTNRWCCASREGIEHVMDPRNSITEANIFQYLLLSNDKNITKDQVKTMASKIPYLNSDNIIDAIYESAQELNINPFYIIGKILQEQGANGSILCAGKGYKNQYVGYYNLFNVGASGNGDDEVILNGLKYAQNKGWDTPKKAIIGGIGLIKKYIDRGQDTLYYQKFNVTYTPYFTNQYAQNVLDAQSIGSTLKKYYVTSNLLNSEFIFEIPLYKNMPTSAVLSPTLRNITETGEIAYINANGGLSLRDSPNGTTLTYVNEGTQILIIERAKEKKEGYYWDKVSTPNGTGYMARRSKRWKQNIFNDNKRI